MAAFEPKKIVTAAGRKIGFEIQCSECPRTDTVPSPSHKGTNPNDAASRMFSNRGWRVGSSHKKHLCPDCLSRKPKLALVETHQPQEPVTVYVQPKPEAPASLDLDTAFIIAARLDDVFDGKRYSQGLDDQLVARDLGVPRDWVRQVRHKRFGVTTEEPEELKQLRGEMTATFKKLENLEIRLGDLLKGLSVLKSDFQQTKDQANKFDERIKKIHDAVK